MPKHSRFAIVTLLFLLAACAAPASLSPTLAPFTTVPPSATLAASPTLPPSPTLPSPPLRSGDLRPSPTGEGSRIAPTLRATTATRTSVPQTATPTSPKISWEVRTLLVGPGQPARLYALLASRFDPANAEQMRFVLSDDQGATWSPFPAGLPVDPVCLHNVNLDYATPDTLYASTCRGLYRWSANRWNLVSSQETWMVAIVYKQPNIIWAISTREKGGIVIRSNNAGVSWNEADYDLVNFSGVANIAIDPRDTNTLYAIINPKYAGSYLRRGNANGRWQTMHTPLNDNVIETGMTIDGASSALYVTMADYSASGNGRWQIWRTLNPSAPDINAVTWEMMHDFGEGPRVSLLASGAGAQGLTLYAQFSPLNGDPYVQHSPDGGKMWARMEIR